MFQLFSGSKAERLTLYNAVQGTTRAKRFYDMPEASESQVKFELLELDKIDIGKPYSITVQLEVR